MAGYSLNKFHILSDQPPISNEEIKKHKAMLTNAITYLILTTTLENNYADKNTDDLRISNNLIDSINRHFNK